MKRLKIKNWSLLLILPLFVSLFGCEKFLDRKPLTATLEDLNQGGLEGQIFGLYNTAARNAGFSSIPWLAVHGFRADDSQKGSDQADGAEWVTVMDNFNYAKDFWATNTYWDDHYVLINQANTALQTADSLKLADASSLTNIAEARFFRAYAYFDLVRTFGEVPKIDFRIYSAAQANIAKSSINEIYALIDSDLQFASANLPKTWGNQYAGRLTSGAAKTLLAKAQLYRKNWAGALGLCNDVINSGVYSLYPSYYGIFKDAGENSSESIFETQNYVGANGVNDYGSFYGTSQGVRGTDANGWNLGWGWNAPTQDLVDAYEPGDPRKAATILFSGQSDDPSSGGYGKILPPFPTIPQKYWNKKVYADPAVQSSTGRLHEAGWINQRILRYADVLLMAAEAANELGGAANGATAEKYVEMVRARARKGDNAVLPPIKFTTQEAMREAIKKERRVEFGMEGERFFDLVRWGDAVKVLGSLGYQNKNRYYPIPQPAIDKSGGKLVQNPEY